MQATSARLEARCAARAARSAHLVRAARHASAVRLAEGRLLPYARLAPPQALSQRLPRACRERRRGAKEFHRARSVWHDDNVCRALVLDLGGFCMLRSTSQADAQVAVSLKRQRTLQ